MKLDVNVLRYLSKDDFRVLTAVEMGQKNVSQRGTRGRAPPPSAHLSAAPHCRTTPCCCTRAAQHEIVPMPLIDSISGLK